MYPPLAVGDCRAVFVTAELLGSEVLAQASVVRCRSAAYGEFAERIERKARNRRESRRRWPRP